MSSGSSSSTADSSVGARGRLILRVALPRLAEQTERLDGILRDYEASHSIEATRRLSDINGIEGLAYLSCLPPDERIEALGDSLLRPDQVELLRGIVERIGDPKIPDSAAAVLQRIVPGIGESDTVDEAGLESSGATGLVEDEPNTVDNLASLAATVDTWPDDVRGVNALSVLARMDISHGSPLPLDFWTRAAARIERSTDPALNHLRFQLGKIIHRKGDPGKALDLWRIILPRLEAGEDLKGKAATLHEMAGVYAQQGDVARALDLWKQSLEIKEQIGDVRGKAATLHEMAGVYAQQGDMARAMDLWKQSMEIKEQIGDVQGKAATLHNMAVFVAQQGDVARAMDLWKQSIEIEEQIGDARGKAATLHQMAGVYARQGDVARAMDLWKQSIDIDEQIGDVKGKAATLAQMAWLAWKQGDRVRERELYIEAARTLARVRAWGDLVKVLSNLGTAESDEATGFLSQAVWLALRIEVPVDAAVGLLMAFVNRIGIEAASAPLAAAYACYLVQTRGGNHPKLAELQKAAQGLIAACAQARNVTPDKFQDWVAAEGLDDPARFIPALEREVEALVPADAWLFDRQTLHA